METSVLNNLSVVGGYVDGQYSILTKGALDFIKDLEQKFGFRRLELLQKRLIKQDEINKSIYPDFLEETENIRQEEWRVASIPNDLLDRRVEITGPVDRKMIINALNSGVKVFMADFEDSNSPTWNNCINGQINLRDAVNKTISFKHPFKDKTYKLNNDIATLMVRPRGWHLEEKNITLNGKPISASLVEFGLYFLHKILLETQL